MHLDLGDIIGMFVIGLIIGAIARLLMPGRDPMGCLMTAILGIVGSFVGGFIGKMLFHPSARGQYYRPGFLLSLVGAIIVLAIYRVVRGRPAP